MPVLYPPIYHTISGNTAGTPALVQTGTLTWAGGPNATLSQDGNAISISVAAPGMPSGDSTKFVQANAVFAGTNASGTIASSGISVSVAAPGAGGGIAAAAGTQTGTSGTVLFADSNGISFGMSASTRVTATYTVPIVTNSSWSVSDAATSGTVARLAFTNLNGVTLSLSSGAGGSHTIVGSHNAITTARASTDAIGLNTAQSNVTWTVNSSGLSLDAGGYAGTGTSATNASITLNSVGLQISVAAPGAGAPASYFDNLAGYIQGTTTQSVSGSTSHIHPFVLPYDISISYLRLLVSANFPATTTIATTNAATGSCSIASTIFAVIYVQNAGASSQSLKSFTSGSVGFTQRWSLSANATAGSQWTLSKTLSFQNTTGATSFTTQSVASTSNISLASNDLTVMTGIKALEIPFAMSLPASNYWFMYGFSSSTATGGSGTLTRLNMSVSNMAVSQVNISMGHLGNDTNASVQFLPGMGSFSTNAIGTTASLGYSNISSSASHIIPWFQLHRTA